MSDQSETGELKSSLAVIVMLFLGIGIAALLVLIFFAIFCDMRLDSMVSKIFLMLVINVVATISVFYFFFYHFFRKKRKSSP